MARNFLYQKTIAFTYNSVNWAAGDRVADLYQFTINDNIGIGFYLLYLVSKIQVFDYNLGANRYTVLNEYNQVLEHSIALYVSGGIIGDNVNMTTNPVGLDRSRFLLPGNKEFTFNQGLYYFGNVVNIQYIGTLDQNYVRVNQVIYDISICFQIAWGTEPVGADKKSLIDAGSWIEPPV